MTQKGIMTNRERVEALLRREKPDRVPIWPIGGEVFSMLQAGGDIAHTFTRPEACLAAHRKASQDFDWVFWPRIWFAGMYCTPWGGNIKYSSGEFSFTPTVVRRPIQTLDEAMNLKKPDVKTAGLVSSQMEFYKLSSQERFDNEPFNVTVVTGGPFSRAGEIPGLELFAKWLLKNPEACHKLLRQATDYDVQLAQYWKDTFGTKGVLVYYGEPSASNQVISAKHFEQFALPYIKELHERILAMGYPAVLVHICGEQNENLPYWAQIRMGDPGIVSIGHEVELDTAARYFPNDIIFGNLDPTIVQAGTPEEVYQISRKIIERGKNIPAGFVFSPGCTLPPKVPRENVEAMAKAVNDYGWYE